MMGKWCVVLALSGVALAGCERPMPPTAAVEPGAVAALREVLDLSAGGGGAAAASLGQPTGWGTLKGVFRLTSGAPSPAALAITKDTEVCAPGGRPVYDEAVVVGPGGGLANVLVYLNTPLPADDPAWEHESYQADKTAEVIFDQKQCIFLSHVSAMRATQRLKVLNSDPVGHNTNLDSKRGAKGDNFTVPAGGFAYYDPGAPSPAPFPVSCSIHPWMKAWLMVCESPYFAVTNAQGEFEIANLPAGVELELRVWQEKAGPLQQVTVNGQSANWPKGRLALKLDPDETRNLEVTLDAAALQ